jgi:hypothetical protein
MKLRRGTHFLEDLANEWRNQYPVVEVSACGKEVILSLVHTVQIQQA